MWSFDLALANFVGIRPNNDDGAPMVVGVSRLSTRTAGGSCKHKPCVLRCFVADNSQLARIPMDANKWTTAFENGGGTVDTFIGGSWFLPQPKRGRFTVVNLTIQWDDATTTRMHRNTFAMAMPGCTNPNADNYNPLANRFLHVQPSQAAEDASTPTSHPMICRSAPLEDPLFFGSFPSLEYDTWWTIDPQHDQDLTRNMDLVHTFIGG